MVRQRLHSPLWPATVEAMFEWAWRKGVLTVLAAKGIVAPFQWNFNDTVKIDEPKVVVDLEMGPGKNKYFGHQALTDQE